MAQSISVDDLFIELGLDLSQLDKDFIDADKTVKQNIAKMRAEKNRINIQMDIDTAKLGPAGTLTDKLKIQEQALSNQLKIQQQTLILVNAEYQKMVNEKGAAVAASSNLHTSLLKEQRTMATLNNQIAANRSAQTAQIQAQAKAASEAFNNELKASQSQMRTGNGGGVLTNMITGAKEALQSGGGFKGVISSIGDSITQMAGVSTTAILGIGTAISVVIGSFKAMAGAAMYAAQAGEQIYKMSMRMHITTQEAAALNSILQVSGVDSSAFTGTMMRVERAVMGVGKGSNETVKALNEFGVSLTDDSGKLLPMNQQLEKLAEGYKNAAKSGQEEEYVARVLGTRGRELIPLIQQLDDKKANLARAHTIGENDIQGAHELTDSLEVLNLQWSRIKVGIADAFLPLVNMFVPAVVGGLNLCIDGVRKFKELIASVNDSSRIVAKMFTNFTDTPLSELYSKSKKQLEDEKAATLQAEKEKQAAAKETADKNNGLSKEQQEADKEILKKIKETAQVRASLREEAYKATHTAIANEMFDIEKKAADLRQKGVEEVYITQYTEAAKAQAMQKFNDETLSKVNSIWQSSLQNRLNDIDKEKKAWQQKGVDEVAATKWAEEQKLSAARNAALEAIKSDRKRLEEVREAMRQQNSSGVVSGVDANGNKISYQLPQKNAMAQLSQQWVAEDRAKLGIAPGDTFSPELIKMYEQIKKYSAGNLVPGLESSMPAPGMNGAQGSKQYNLTGPIQVEINNPMVDNDGQLNILADKVADKIKPAVVEALGGTANGY
jgi:hypothetical protein